MVSLKAESDHVTHSCRIPEEPVIASRTIAEPRHLTPKVLEDVAGFPGSTSAIARHILFLPVTVVPQLRGAPDFSYVLHF